MNQVKIIRQIPPIDKQFIPGIIVKKSKKQKAQWELLLKYQLKMMKFMEGKQSEETQYNQKWSQFIGQIKQAQLNTLILVGCQRSTILADIVHIKFSLLVCLNLSSSTIQNIQALSFLDAPYLNVLSLDSNKIRSLKGLKKVNLKVLKSINLKLNIIKEVKDFSRLKGSRQIKVQIFRTLSNNKPNNISDPYQIVKLQSSQPQEINKYYDKKQQIYKKSVIHIFNKINQFNRFNPASLSINKKNS